MSSRPEMIARYAGKEPAKIPREELIDLVRWGRHELGLAGADAGDSNVTSLTRAVRAKCVDCCVGSSTEVARCSSIDCPLWPFRLGVNPFRGSGGNAGNIDALKRYHEQKAEAE